MLPAIKMPAGEWSIKYTPEARVSKIYCKEWEGKHKIWNNRKKNSNRKVSLKLYFYVYTCIKCDCFEHLHIFMTFGSRMIKMYIYMNIEYHFCVKLYRGWRSKFNEFISIFLTIEYMFKSEKLLQ